jgi:hypothetical protein
MAVRLSQATSKVGRAVWSLPALSSAAGKAVGGRFGKRSLKVSKNLVSSRWTGVRGEP